VLGLIPARGGSKGIVRKNLASLGGRPLIEHTVKAAQRAQAMTEVWVSSDDDEILQVAAALGACTLRRPAVLADDQASAIDVVSHFLASLPRQVLDADPIIVYLQPTSPFRRERHIDEALAGMVRCGADAAVGVVALSKSPFKAFCLDGDGRLLSLFDERQSNMRRQDLPTCYLPNGAIYAFRVSAFRTRAGFPSNGAWPYLMSDEDSIDIDSAQDLARAQALIGDQHA
jgi:CMP-N-acetylneuraminic acid synthetase